MLNGFPYETIHTEMQSVNVQNYNLFFFYPLFLDAFLLLDSNSIQKRGVNKLSVAGKLKHNFAFL